jgi:hypothetical protein
MKMNRLSENLPKNSREVITAIKMPIKLIKKTIKKKEDV